MSFLDPRERERAKTQTLTANFYDVALEASKTFRKGYAEQVNIVKAADMPFERSRHGLIKHIINEQMNTKEYCLDIYMQFLPVGKARASIGICRRKCSMWSKGRAMTCTGTCASTART